MEIKKCTISDKYLLREIAEKTYRSAFAPFNKQSDIEKYAADAFSIEKIEQELSNPNSVFAFAVQDEQILGYTKLNYAPAQTELNDTDSLEIERIYILPEHQCKQAGQHLIDYAVICAAKEQLDYVWLGVWEHNAGAIRFYERNGFYRFSEHIFQLGEDKQTDYLMRKDLSLD